jgi:adenosylcobinamide-GDP ribazoletransferase
VSEDAADEPGTDVASNRDDGGQRETDAGPDEAASGTQRTTEQGASSGREAASDAGQARERDPAGGLGAALAGGVGFLSRLPVGTDLRGWEAFRHRPVAFVPAGYLVGALVALPVLLGLPAVTLAVVYPAALVLVTGINHADGVADLGDAAVVHGDVEERVRVLKDSQLGVGGTVALVLLFAGLALGALGLAGQPVLQAAGVVVAAEVGAKLGMAMLACLGTAPFEGLGSQLTAVSDRSDLLAPMLVALPAAFLSWPSPAAGAALAAAVVTTILVWRWADGYLGGVNGDVFGATNELARVVALHAGVVAWTLS